MPMIEEIEARLDKSQQAIKRLREEARNLTDQAKQRNHLADKVAKNAAKLRKQLKILREIERT